MKVLMMIHGLPTGGAERNMLSLLPRLSALDVDLRLCTLNGRRDGPLADALGLMGIPRHDLGARSLTDVQALGRLGRFLRDERFDLVHAQDPYSAMMAGAVGAVRQVRIVMTRHVLDEPAGTVAAAARRQLLHASVRHLFSRVIAVSECVRQRFSEIARVSLDRIDTVFNGIDVAGFAPGAVRAEMRRKLGLAATEKVLVMVAVMRGGKGHEVLFDAAARLSPQVPDLKVLLVGDGPDAPALRALAAPLGDRIRFLGTRSDVPDILAASDVLVLPSWSEALPNVLLEAGAAGLPSIATRVGGIGEILEHGRTGFLIEPGDAAALASYAGRLVTEQDLARAMGEAARQRIEAVFSLDQQARHTRAVYERTLEGCR